MSFGTFLAGTVVSNASTDMLATGTVVSPNGTPPEGAQLVCCLGVQSNNNHVYQAVSGWELKFTQISSAGTNITTAVYTKKAGASEGSSTFKTDNDADSPPNWGVMLTFPDGHATIDFDVVFNSGDHHTNDTNTPTTNDIAHDPITTLTKNAVVVCLVHHNGDAAVTATAEASGYTALVSDITNANRSFQISTKVTTAAGVETPGVAAWTSDAGTGDTAFFTFALRDALQVYVDSAAVGADNGKNWTDAYPTLVGALAANSGGDVYWLASGHAEAHSGTDLMLDFEQGFNTPDRVISVDKSDDTYLKGALLNVTSAHAVDTNGNVRMYGVVLRTGTGGSNGNNDLEICQNNYAYEHFIDCDFDLNSTNSTSQTRLGTSSGNLVIWENCRYRHGAGSGPISAGSKFIWKGGSIISGSGSSALGLFAAQNEQAEMLIDGVDFSNDSTDLVFFRNWGGGTSFYMRNCKTPASWVGDYVVQAADEVKAADVIEFENVGRADVNYTYHKEMPSGTVDEEVELYPTGTDGALHNTATVPLGYKMVSNARCVPDGLRLESLPIPIYNEDTTSQTWTLEFIHNDGALLQDDDAALVLSYPGESGGQLGSFATDAIDDPFGTPTPFATPANITASTKDWDDGLTERANSTAYVVGDKVKQAGSAGSAFIVKSISGTGTTAGTPPAGFTSASDGDEIIDNPGANQVVWGAMYRQKCAVTVTAAEQGSVQGVLSLSKANLTLWAANHLVAS